MTPRPSWGRIVVMVGLLSALSAVALPGLRAGRAGRHQADPLTREAIRELVARLSDAEARELLLAQLDKAAAPADAKAERVDGGRPRGGYGPCSNRDRRRAPVLVARCPPRSATR